MFTQLHIQNLAIIQDLRIDFPKGLTVITGASGAGKSLLFTALHLVLGGKSHPSLIRPKAAYAQIDLTLEWPEKIHLRRQLYPHGGSLFFYNHRKCSSTLIKNLAAQVWEYHGQHASLRLRQESEQRELLDIFGQHQALCLQVSQAAAALRKTREALAIVQPLSAIQEELFFYQYEELDQFQAKKDEYEALFAQHKYQHHAQEYSASLEESRSHLEQIRLSLYTALKQILLLPVSTDQKNLIDILEQAQCLMQEASSAHQKLQKAQEQADPESGLSLEEIDARLDGYSRLARKYKVPPQELSQLYAQWTLKKEGLARQKIEEEALQAQEQQQWQEYQDLAHRLHTRRAETALVLAQTLMDKAPALGLTHLSVKIDVAWQKESLSPHGSDRIAWTLSFNPGHPLSPVEQCASGGELSRLSLLTTLLTAQSRTIPVLVLDEVDVGLGGDLAGTLGELLAQLAHPQAGTEQPPGSPLPEPRQAQILCISHAASLAKKAEHHLLIEKHYQGADDIVNTASWLAGPARQAEEHRLMGLESEKSTSWLSQTDSMQSVSTV